MKKTLLAFGLLGAANGLFGQVPALINYQGHVTAAGTNVNGTGWFKFALIQQTTNQARQATATATIVNGAVTGVLITDDGSGYVSRPGVTISAFPGAPGAGATASATLAGGAVSSISVLTPGSNYNAGAIVLIDPPPGDYAALSFWSNDGSSANGSEPSLAMAIGVANGLFTVNLGDPLLTVGLDPTLFTNSPLWLRIWFSADGTVFQRLTPDQPLTAVPYAMMAANAANAANAVNAANAANATAASTMPWGGLTGVPAGSGLQLSGGNTFNVAFGGNGTSNTVGHSDHNHLGQTWLGPDNVGLSVNTSGNGNYAAALYGAQGGATPAAIGVSGVRGASVTGFGVLGESSSGTAVMGYSTGWTGTTYGVQGFAGATNGAGVKGFASSSSGTTFAVQGLDLSDSGMGVQGNAASVSGNTIGVQGLAASAAGIGVQGSAPALSGNTLGVAGAAYSPTGVGVYGLHNAGTGSAPGVKGETASADGAASGVLGRVSGASPSAYSAGVRGLNEGPDTAGIGVLGYSGPPTNAVLGTANTGVSGVSWTDGGNGVVGEANNGFSAYGVWGKSANGFGGNFSGGLFGLVAASPFGTGGSFSGGAYGIYGTSSGGTGGYFSGTTNGVRATSTTTGSGAGVQGNGFNGVIGTATQNNGNGVVGEANLGSSAYGVLGSSTSGYGGVFNGGSCGVAASGTTYGVSASGGTYSLYASGGSYGLWASGSSFGMSISGSSYISYNSSLSKPTLELHETGSGNYARFRLSSYTNPYWDIAVGGGAANWMNFYNSSNGNVMTLSQAGDLSVATLTIRGGADVAEPFPMSDPEIAKGAVVVIDAEHPGQLKLSDRAYDTRVAGIVSGANGIQPGLSLRQEGALAGGQNVALTGRVYVQADAANGAIQPGDLLTTSDTPGYAMKVTDHARAQGAILGKAMTTLKDGRGTVLVLVTLQ